MEMKQGWRNLFSPASRARFFKKRRRIENGRTMVLKKGRPLTAIISFALVKHQSVFKIDAKIDAIYKRITNLI